MISRDPAGLPFIPFKSPLGDGQSSFKKSLPSEAPKNQPSMSHGRAGAESACKSTLLKQWESNEALRDRENKNPVLKGAASEEALALTANGADGNSVFDEPNFSRFCGGNENVMAFLKYPDVAKRMKEPLMRRLTQKVFEKGFKLEESSFIDESSFWHGLEEKRTIKVMPAYLGRDLKEEGGAARMASLAFMRRAFLAAIDFDEFPPPTLETHPDPETFFDTYIAHRMDRIPHVLIADIEAAREAGSSWGVRKTRKDVRDDAASLRLNRSPLSKAWRDYKKAYKEFEKTGSTDAIKKQWGEENEITFENGYKRLAYKACKEWIREIFSSGSVAEQVESITSYLKGMYSHSMIATGDDGKQLHVEHRPRADDWFKTDAHTIMSYVLDYEKTLSWCGIGPEQMALFRAAYFEKMVAPTLPEAHRALFVALTRPQGKFDPEIFASALALLSQPDAGEATADHAATPPLDPNTATTAIHNLSSEDVQNYDKALQQLREAGLPVVDIIDRRWEKNTLRLVHRAYPHSLDIEDLYVYDKESEGNKVLHWHGRINSFSESFKEHSYGYVDSYFLDKRKKTYVPGNCVESLMRIRKKIEQSKVLFGRPVVYFFGEQGEVVIGKLARTEKTIDRASMLEELDLLIKIAQAERDTPYHTMRAVVAAVGQADPMLLQKAIGSRKDDRADKMAAVFFRSPPEGRPKKKRHYYDPRDRYIYDFRPFKDNLAGIYVRGNDLLDFDTAQALTAFHDADTAVHEELIARAYEAIWGSKASSDVAVAMKSVTGIEAECISTRAEGDAHGRLEYSRLRLKRDMEGVEKGKCAIVLRALEREHTEERSIRLLKGDEFDEIDLDSAGFGYGDLYVARELLNKDGENDDRETLLLMENLRTKRTFSFPVTVLDKHFSEAYVGALPIGTGNPKRISKASKREREAAEKTDKKDDKKAHKKIARVDRKADGEIKQSVEAIAEFGSVVEDALVDPEVFAEIDASIRETNAALGIKNDVPEGSSDDGVAVASAVGALHQDGSGGGEANSATQFNNGFDATTRAALDCIYTRPKSGYGFFEWWRMNDSNHILPVAFAIAQANPSLLKGMISGDGKLIEKSRYWLPPSIPSIGQMSMSVAFARPSRLGWNRSDEKTYITCPEFVGALQAPLGFDPDSVNSEQDVVAALKKNPNPHILARLVTKAYFSSKAYWFGGVRVDAMMYAFAGEKGQRKVFSSKKNGYNGLELLGEVRAAKNGAQAIVLEVREKRVAKRVVERVNGVEVEVAADLNKEGFRYGEIHVPLEVVEETGEDGIQQQWLLVVDPETGREFKFPPIEIEEYFKAAWTVDLSARSKKIGEKNEPTVTELETELGIGVQQPPLSDAGTTES